MARVARVARVGRTDPVRERDVVDLGPSGADARPRALSLLAYGILGAALVLIATVAAVSPARPSLVALALLGTVALLCANRESLFSSELAATAEAAVVLCAVVVFADGAPLLGPVIVGFATGWFDLYHWSSRAWTRMAFNSGNRALGACAAALALHGVLQATSGSGAGVVVAGVAAAIVFSVVDAAMVVVLLRVRDRARIGAALRDVARLDATSIPLALYGAAAGLVAVEGPVWIGILAVVPVAWVPETLLGPRSRLRSARVRRVALASTGVAAAFAAGLLTLGLDRSGLVAAVVVSATLVGAELRPDHRFLVVPASGAAVMLAVASVPAAAPAAGALAGGTAIVMSRVFGGVRPGVGATAAAITLGAAAGWSWELLGATLGLAVFFVGCAMSAAVRRGRARGVGEVVWSTVPVVLVAANAGASSRWLGPGAALASGTGALALVVVAVVCAGPPPWRSRSARWIARGWRIVPGWVFTVGFTVLFVACDLMAVVTFASAGDAAGWIVAAAFAVALAAATTVARTRLWRFAPRGRALEEGVVVGAALVACTGALDLGRGALACGVVSIAGVVVVVAGRWPARLADRARPMRVPGDTRSARDLARDGREG